MHLRCTFLHISRPGVIRSGCVEIAFADATDERIRKECKKAKYSEEVTEQYIKAIRWMIEGCESGALDQGEVVEDGER
ncbi:MAG: hypothetical protein EB060_10860 [Proteobacteria bacterium]|nr:hypothetical protein [Pseudomonadota bacterium]